MAFIKATVQHEIDNLERAYRSAIEHYATMSNDPAMRRVEAEYADRLAQLQRKYCMDNDQMNRAMGAIANPYAGVGPDGQLGQSNNQNGAVMNLMMQNAAMGQQRVIKPAEEKNGVLMFRGAPLPDKWMGAFYAMVNRVPVGKQWKISFNSEFSSDTIMLWLSMDEFSGNDADKVAATYLETINQRRIG